LNLSDIPLPGNDHPNAKPLPQANSDRRP
jgi:hypothetical protein